MYYVYVLQHHVTKKLDYGYTSQLEQRYAQHRREGPWELLYYEAYRGEADARLRERRLKAYGQAVVALKGRLTHSLG